MAKYSQSIDDRILRSIRAQDNATAFMAKHFLQFGHRPAISQALNRLVQAGRLRRVRRGLYDLPQSHPIIGQTAPDPMAVVRALMDGSGAQWQAAGAYAANLLGLSEQVPAKIMVLTDGVTRRITLGKLAISFRHASPRNLLGAGRPSGLVIQAIRYLRKEGVSAQMIRRLSKQLDSTAKSDLLKLAPNLPVWMQPIVRQIAA